MGRVVLALCLWIACASVANAQQGPQTSQNQAILSALNQSVTLNPAFPAQTCTLSISQVQNAIFTTPFVGSVTFSESGDGSTFTPLATVSAPGNYVYPCGGYYTFKAQMTAYTSGAATVLIVANPTTSAVSGANIFGAITQATNVRTNVIDLTKPPYSIDPTGTVDATATIQNAINSNAGPNVEFDFCPTATATGTARPHYKISSTIVIGNGTNSAFSTTNQGIRLIGCGAGVTVGAGTPFKGTSFDWYGATGGTAFVINGPISSMLWQGFYVDCRGVCATAYAMHNFERSKFSDLWAQNYTGTGWIIDAYLSDTTVSGGTQYNIFDQFGSSTYVTGSTGFQIGALGVSTSYDVSGNEFIGMLSQASVGAIIAMADGNNFIGGQITGTGGPSVNFTIENGGYPGAIYFEGTGFSGSGNAGVMSVTGTYTGEAGQIAIIDPWNDGGGNNPPVPPVTGYGANEFFSGVTTSGMLFGPQQTTRYSNSGYSGNLTASGLFSLQYAFPTTYFNHPGTTVHVTATIVAGQTAAGDVVYPYLSLGGVRIASFANQPITLPNGASNIRVDFDFNNLAAIGTNIVTNATGHYLAQTDSLGAFVVTPNVGVLGAGNTATGLSPNAAQTLQIGANVTGTHTTLQIKQMRVDGTYGETY